MTAVLKNTLNSTVKQSLERKILCTQPFESPHYFIQKKKKVQIYWMEYIQKRSMHQK